VLASGSSEPRSGSKDGVERNAPANRMVALEVPESVPNLLGQVPLEVLDLVVDTKGQKLVPNPAHGGEQMTEEY